MMRPVRTFSRLVGLAALALAAARVGAQAPTPAQPSPPQPSATQAPEGPEVESRLRSVGDFCHDLRGRNQGWFFYPTWAPVYTEPAPLLARRGGFIEAVGPHWLDRNHHEPGVGDLHLLAVQYARTVADPDGRSSDEGIKYGPLRLGLSAREMQATVWWNATDLRGAHIYFWFQTMDYRLGKMVNYILSSHPVDMLVEPRTWGRVTLPMSGLNASWTCLGSSVARRDLYDCGDVDYARRLGAIDFGFVVLPIDEDAPEPLDIRFRMRDFCARTLEGATEPDGPPAR